MKKLFFTLVLFSIIFHTEFISAETINVPGDQPTIQAGINAASVGDTVLVHPGTYIETINFLGKDIVVGSLFITTQDTSYISQTIIDGNNENYHLVSFVNGETPEAILSGFTIRNANTGYLYTDVAGFGIRIQNSSPVITNNIIEDNWCYWYMNGCGIGAYNSSATIKNNIIRNNAGAYNGGGIFIDGSTGLKIEHNEIYGNTTMSGYGVAYGAGICLLNSNGILIKRNLIHNNFVDFGDGGGIAIKASSGIIQNNTITNNTANGVGKGIFLDDYSSAGIINNIVWDNHPENSAQIVPKNANVVYSLVQGGYEGEGNIETDPLFYNPSGNNYLLTLQSPCINAGSPGINPDPDGTIADMGYQYFNMSQYGTIKGMVTLNGGYGTLKNVIVETIDQFTNPDPEGNYKINLLPGTYTISAYLEGYSNNTAFNIELSQGQVVSGINFLLNSNYLNHTIHIKQDGTGDFITIQEGVDAAISGDTILIYPGTYEENVTLYKNLVVASKYIIDLDTAYIAQTIIDGGNSGHTIIVDEFLNNYTEITGFTVINSITDYNCLYSYNSSFRLNHCSFPNQTTSTFGKKVLLSFCHDMNIENNIFSDSINDLRSLYIYYSDNINILENRFINNSIGIDSRHSFAHIAFNHFIDNHWGISGKGEGTIVENNYFNGNADGLYCSDFSPKIINNHFYNSSTAIYCSAWSEALIANNLIVNCTSDGIKCLHASPTIVNNTIVNNSTGIRFDDESTGEVIDNIVWGNESSFLIIQGAEIKISYSCIEGDFPPNAT
ncbi:MAG: right-handed parallel beta-helix repeat-containing protein, partial [Bacteroidales bacterium]|nr:right-handed parallel beta-helix repeat-containing protein [Bacteroidales bacterium]